MLLANYPSGQLYGRLFIVFCVGKFLPQTPHFHKRPWDLVGLLVIFNTEQLMFAQLYKWTGLLVHQWRQWFCAQHVVCVALKNLACWLEFPQCRWFIASEQHCVDASLCWECRAQP